MTISPTRSEAERPLVSVIIPAYCAASYLERAVNSVREQTHRNIEIIIVDDGSTDDTLAIAMALAETDERIQVLHQSQSGAASARQLAAKHANGKYIAPIDADDLWAPQNLRRQVDCLEENPEVAVSYSWSVHIDEDDR
ncbi:MAG TPA: glycosyltransferase family 2 protein, partial [Trichormus sp.]